MTRAARTTAGLRVGLGIVRQARRLALRVGVATLMLAPLLALADRTARPPPTPSILASASGTRASHRRGHGDIDLAANTVSGILCQVDRVRRQPDRLIVMTVERRLIYHSHYAVMWGFPGNVMKIVVRVQSSTDPACHVGSRGHVTLFASYNGVRSDSVQFTFPGACGDHDHMYHGAQVDNQVPPL